MGQFSWMFADTDNKQALCEDHEGYVYLPTGRYYHERCYGGYGRFDGNDVYDLVADWNREFLSRNPEYIVPQHGRRILDDGSIVDAVERRVDSFPWYKAYADLSLSREDVVKESGIYEYRHIGIDIACYDDQNAKLPFPIKICKFPPAVVGNYFLLPASEGDPNQGWGEPEEEEYDA